MHALLDFPEIGATLVRPVPAGALFARPHAAMRRMSVALGRMAGGARTAAAEGDGG